MDLAVGTSLVKYTLVKVNDSSDVVNASNICNSIGILLDIRWIKQAWKSVTSETAFDIVVFHQKVEQRFIMEIPFQILTLKHNIRVPLMN